jgi:hypothetical protein
METITSPSSPYAPVIDANGNPIDGDIVITGAGWTPGSVVYAEVCDGASLDPPSYLPAIDCDPVTSTAGALVDSAGDFSFNGANLNYQVEVFRGVGPDDQFNCLAPGDDPDARQVTTPDPQDAADVASIDPNVPSWGSSTVGAAGGGTADCRIRITYSPVLAETSDQFINLELQAGGAPVNPPSTVPETSRTVLPAVAAAPICAGGLYFRRRVRHVRSRRSPR